MSRNWHETVVNDHRPSKPPVKINGMWFRQPGSRGSTYMNTHSKSGRRRRR